MLSVTSAESILSSPGPNHRAFQEEALKLGGLSRKAPQAAERIYYRLHV